MGLIVEGMPSRRRHPRKEIELVCREAERAGWRIVIPKKGYWKAYCPCPEEHKRSVHLTPSNPNYVRNLRAWFRRQPCWRSR